MNDKLLHWEFFNGGHDENKLFSTRNICPNSSGEAFHIKLLTVLTSLNLGYGFSAIRTMFVSKALMYSLFNELNLVRRTFVMWLLNLFGNLPHHRSGFLFDLIHCRSHLGIANIPRSYIHPERNTSNFRRLTFPKLSVEFYLG